MVFLKFRFLNVFRPHENEKLAFTNSSGLKSVFEKFCFGDRLVWTVRRNKLKLRFHKFLRRSVDAA